MTELASDIILTVLVISAWPDAVEYFQFNQTVEIFFKVTGTLFAYCFTLYFSHHMGRQIGLHIIAHRERKNLK